MKHLIIIGAGGFAREVYWHAQESIGYGEEWDIKGFLDGDVKLAEDEYKKLQLPVLGDINDYEIKDDDVFICAVAEPRIKEKLVKRILERGCKFINLIHKTARIHGTAKMGIGNILCPFSGLQDSSVIGDFVSINCSSGLGHDACAEDYTTLSSGVDIMGYVSVGKRCFFASGSRVLPHGKVEDDVYVGVLSAVFKKAKAGTTVFGNPAMPI